MKIYLFLYPIREYVEALMPSPGMFRDDGHNVERLSHIIDARYRQKDYKVWWLLFSSSSAIPEFPDYSRLSSDIIVSERDVFLACGVTFKRHVSEEMYPDPSFILRQMPRNVHHLVLGGFHQWDCVDKIAAAAYKQGTSVIVDEDTTEHFFCRTCLLGEIPLVRPLYDHVREIAEQWQDMINIVIERRKDKPWFSPVPDLSSIAPPAP